MLRYIREMVDGVQSFLVGMKTTGGFMKDVWAGDGIVTREYPAKKAELPDRYRGHLFNNVDECTLCKSCMRACPIDCISMDGEINENGKQHISRYDIDISKCIYCGLCTQACPTDCLTMTKGFEISPTNAVNKRGGRYLYRQGPEEIKRRLDSLEVERLNRLTALPPEQLTDDDRAFLATIENPKGRSLVAKFGMGFYTPEEKAEVERIRAEKKKAKEAAAAAAAAAAESSDPAAVPPLKPAPSAAPAAPAVPPAPQAPEAAAKPAPKGTPDAPKAAAPTNAPKANGSTPVASNGPATPPNANGSAAHAAPAAPAAPVPAMAKDARATPKPATAEKGA